MVDFAKIRESMRRPIEVPDVVVGVSGHRPHKLPDRETGYQWANPLRTALRERLEAATRAVLARHADARCTCSTWETPDPACVVGQELGNHRRGQDRGRALHVDSYLRRVEWSSGWGGEAWRRIRALGVTGAALGVDQDMAGVWRRMGIPYVCAIPFPGQDARWPTESRRVYEKVLACAAGVVYVTTERPQTDEGVKEALHKRNEWNCCVSDEMIGVWDGSGGGTASCLHYWRHLAGPPAVLIDPREVLRG